jgi:hypothetical protein
MALGVVFRQEAEDFEGAIVGTVMPLLLRVSLTFELGCGAVRVVRGLSVCPLWMWYRQIFCFVERIGLMGTQDLVMDVG